MIRLLYFIRTQKGRREGVFMYFGMEETWGLYSNDRGNINGRKFNKG